MIKIKNIINSIIFIYIVENLNYSLEERERERNKNNNFETI